MAKTISNFLVGIGFDLDKKSTDNVASGIDNVKTKALQLGSVVAGAFGIKALTSDFANAKDDLGKFGQVFGVTASDVSAFGNAMRIEGGTLEGFMSQLSQLEQFRAGLAVGDAGFLAQAGRAGLDVSGLVDAESATEGFLELADQFQAMTQQQRLNAATALGLDEATIRLLSRGRSNIEDLVDAQRKLRPVTDEMTEAARIFNEENKNLMNNIGGIADQVSVRLLPQISNVVAGMNDWIEANRELIGSGLDTFFDSINENVVAIAASLGLVTSGATALAAGKLAGKVGLGGAGRALGGVGGLATRFGGLGLAGAGGVAVGTAIQEKLPPDVSDAIGGAIANALAFFGNKEAAAAVSARENMRPIEIRVPLTLDGKVIDERVVRTVGGMADQAIQDTRNSEGP
jgi:hypothetical protein